MVEGLRAGEEVGGYRLESVIGRGGMGVVFLATHAKLGRQVALKVIVPELARKDAFRRRFERESKLAASIEHPHAVPVYEVGETPDRGIFIAMRYVEGTDLRAVLQAEQWLEPVRATGLLQQVAGALDEAHSHGLVHRDVKPANILIGEVGGQEWAYLTDFGATKPASAATDITATGEWLGTLDYASPEQIEGDRGDARSDVYSLGCVLFETLTGQIPFERENHVAKLYAHVNDPPPSVSDFEPGLPAGLDRMVARALAKDPKDRYPSAGDLGRAASAAAAGQATTTRERSVAIGEAKSGVSPDSEPTRAISRLGPPRFGDGPPWRWIAAMAALAAVIAAAVLLLLPESEPEVVDTIEVGKGALGVAVGQDSVWVTDQFANRLAEIDPETNDLAGDPIDVGDSPTGVAAGEGSVWVANSDDDTVSRVNPETGDFHQIEVGDRPAGIRAGRGSVWVANIGDDTVSRIDPATERVETIEVGDGPSGVAIGETGVYVSNSIDGTVSRILPSSGDVVDTIQVGTRPRGVAIGAGYIWVALTSDKSVTRIKESTREVEGDPIEVGRAPAAVTVGEKWVWVTNERDNTVSRIDPDTGEVVGTLEVGSKPKGIDVGEGSVWAANSAGGTVFRIDD